MSNDDEWIARVSRLEEEVSGLRRALRSRGLIEQAKGILAERLRTDPESAFKHLSQRSQRRNISVIELAAEIVAGGTGRARLARSLHAAQTASSLPELADILVESHPEVAAVGFAVIDGGKPRIIASSGDVESSEHTLHPVRAANADIVMLVRWVEAQPAEAEEFAATVDKVTRRLWVPPELPWEQSSWLRTVFSVVYGEAALLSPVRDESGAIVDFAIDASTADDAGAMLLDREPHLVGLGVFASYVKALDESVPFDRPAAYETLVHRGKARRLLLRRRAVRLGDLLLVSKEHLDRAQRQNEQIAQMEVIGGLGFGEWDLATGEIFWSPGLYRLLGREQSAGPSALDRLPRLVQAADATYVQEMLDLLTKEHLPVDFEFHVDNRVIRMVAEARSTPHGDVHIVQAVAREITEERHAAEVLRRTEVQLGEQRMRAAAEREMTRQMRQIWYPANALEINAPGIRVRGRHWVPEEDRRFQADFLDAAKASDGDVLVAIGDIVGSGLAAAATMTRLMYPARVMGHAGSPPAEILEALNTELSRGESADMAGLVLARYLVEEGTMIWAQAGHLAPVLLRGGTARQLVAPPGVLLGLRTPGRYGQATLRPEPGDLVIFFTDGATRRSMADPLPPLMREFEKHASTGGADALLDGVIERSDSEACLVVVEFLRQPKG